MITLQAFRCKDCKHDFSIYVDSKKQNNIICENCKSTNLAKTYLPIIMRSESEGQVVTKGEETMKVIEENRFILDRMKQEKM